jgi:molybdenum cofactor biosynthesis enzyme MoaA
MAVVVPPIDLVAGRLGTPAALFDEFKRQITYLRISVTDRSLRSVLRGGKADPCALTDILRSAMFIKPERHHLEVGEAASAMRAFSEIGG